MLKKGFTILELLIVIAVIAILVGIALPRFKGMKDEGNFAKAKGELNTLKTAIESYNIHQSPNAYPATTTTICATNLINASPKIVGNVLYDPFLAAPTEYNYIRSSGGNYYVVYSVGPNTNGSCTIADDTGVVVANNGAIYATNGQ